MVTEAPVMMAKGAMVLERLNSAAANCEVRATYKQIEKRSTPDWIGLSPRAL